MLLLRRKSLATDTVMVAPLHWTEMAPAGTEGAAFKPAAVAALLVATAVADMETAEDAGGAELPDAGVVTSVAGVEPQPSHAGLWVGAEVGSPAAEHSDPSAPQVFAPKGQNVVICSPTLTSSAGPFRMVVLKSVQTGACVRPPRVCARGPLGTVVVPRRTFIKI